MRLVFVFILMSLMLYMNEVNSESLHKLTEDIEAYCKYIEQKNQAKLNLLYSPDLVVRVQNSNNEELLQNNLVSGVSKDISDFSKAKFIKQLTKDECTYYQLNQESKLQIEFAIPWIRAQALRLKLQDIQVAKSKLHRLLNTIQRKIKYHNDTLVHYYQMDALLKQIENEERDIKVNLAIQRLPPIQSIRLKTLFSQVKEAERKRQVTRNKLIKQDSWSLQLLAGEQQSITDNQKMISTPYLGLFARYNLGALSSSHHVDKSLTDYMNWKNKQVDGVQSQLLDLIKAVSLLKSAQQNQLESLKLSYQKYDGLGKKINKINSIKAEHFSQQLEVDHMMMDIEIKYLKHMVDLLEKILMS